MKPVMIPVGWAIQEEETHHGDIDFLAFCHSLWILALLTCHYKKSAIVNITSVLLSQQF